MTVGAARSLSEAHRARLHAGGLTDAVIDARGYWTLAKGEGDLAKQLGHSADVVRGGDALVIPHRDVYGAVTCLVARPDHPRLDDKGKPRKYEFPRNAKTTIDVPPAALPELQGDGPVWVVEGQKKADAAIAAGALCAIALLGVWNWKKNALPAWDSILLRDRTFRLTFDSDAETNPKVMAALRRLKAFLESRGAVVVIVHLEAGPDGEKVGLDDALAAGATLEDLAASATEHLRLVPDPADDKRPELDVTHVHQATTRASFPPLRQAGVYRGSDGRLIRAVREHNGALRLEPLTVQGVRALLDRVVRSVRRSDSGSVPTLPPRDLGEMIVNDPSPALPDLRGIVSSPVFLADGTYLDRPGYDPTSMLLVDIRGWSPRAVSATPTAEDVAEARRLIDGELLGDVPFASECDQTHIVALALTPAVREMVTGPTPLFDVQASVAGSGKGLTAAAATGITMGRNGVQSLSMPREEAEFRKAITGVLSSGRSVTLFDNVTGRVASSVLAKVLTDLEWADRILGQSKVGSWPVRQTWLMTSNNPSMSDEIVRRVVTARIEPQMDHPELRTTFRHPDLLAWADVHRADLFWALAVFVRAWIAANRPAPTCDAIGSYESWRFVVGGILEHAGYRDFLMNRRDMAASADPDTEAWKAFTADWFNRFGDRYVGAGDLVPLAETAEVYLNGETDKARATSLGVALRKKRGRFFYTHQIVQGSGSNRRDWRLKGLTLKASDASDTSDTSDTSVIPFYAGAHACAAACDNGGVTGVRGVIATGAVSRLVVDHADLLLESLDGTTEYARLSASAPNPDACLALREKVSPVGFSAQRADLERMAAKLQTEPAA